MADAVRNPIVRFALFILALDAISAAGVGVSVAVLNQSNANYAATIKLNQALDRDAAISRANAAKAASQATTTRSFVDEINFICSTDLALAKRMGLPPPPPDICNLGVP